MSAKSIRAKANQFEQRKRMREMRLGDLLNKGHDYKEVTTDEVTCPHCGFKARYKFHRCPNCDEVQK